MTDNGLLAGKKIVITGAARGLGKDFACAAGRAGAELLLADILSEQLETVAQALRGHGIKVYSRKLDLADKGSIESVALFAREIWGKADGLVNCAAVATDVGGKDLTEYDPDLWDKVMNVNVKGTWLMTQAFVPLLKKSQSGKIVNIASDTALWGAPKLMAYVASKGAVMAMSRSMARELGEFNICVNTVAPGLTLCEATEYVPQERHDLYVGGRAIRREQYPEDVAGTVVYLLSDLSSFVTGQLIPVNGGFVFN